MTGPPGTRSGTSSTGSARRLLVAVLGMVAVLVIAILVATRMPGGTSQSDENAVTVGDLHAQRMRIRVNGVRSSSVAPLRTGDLLTLHAQVTTSGAQSLWVRTLLDFAGTDPRLARHLHVYDGPLPTGVALKAAQDITDPITFPGYVGTADAPRLHSAQPFVLDGTKETEAAGIGAYPVAVAIYVDPETPADLLSRPLKLTAVVQSVPYRAHPDDPADDQWIQGPALPLG